jgi:ribonucleoside-diphosphate reductase alpha chain
MARVSLPSRRECVTQKFKIMTPDERGKNPTLFITVGLKEDGSPGEIKIILSSTGSTERAYTDLLSYTISVGLQNGVPLSEYVEQFLNTKFLPYGPVTGYKYIKFCSSPLDLAFRWLGIKYCQMWDLAILEANETVDTNE